MHMCQVIYNVRRCDDVKIYPSTLIITSDHLRGDALADPGLSASCTFKLSYIIDMLYRTCISVSYHITRVCRNLVASECFLRS
jgi:hypothetical protein